MNSHEFIKDGLPGESASNLREREADLQRKIDTLVGGDELFAAGILSFEQTELLAQLKESPAARRAAEFAILLAQRDLETTALALELMMEDLPFDPHIDIATAKFDLREAMENKLGDGVNVELVRALAAAYLGKAPTESLYKTRMWSSFMQDHPNGWHLQRTTRRMVAIETKGRPAKLWLESTTVHKPKVFGMAYSSASYLPAKETIGYEQGLYVMRVKVNDFASMTEAMANQLLRLPDEPVYVNDEAPSTYSPIAYLTYK